MLSASAVGRFFNTVSTLATMFFVGIFFGVTEKFRPFSRRSFSWGDNVLVERLTTHSDVSVVDLSIVNNCDLVLNFTFLAKVVIL